MATPDNDILIIVVATISAIAMMMFGVTENEKIKQQERSEIHRLLAGKCEDHTIIEEEKGGTS